jgi:uncharacterized protein (TIGR02145 family)
MRKFHFILLVVLFSCGKLQAQNGLLKGKISTDNILSMPIVGARVNINNTYQSISGGDGNFELNVPYGEYIMSIYMEKFDTVLVNIFINSKIIEKDIKLSSISKNPIKSNQPKTKKEEKNLTNECLAKYEIIDESETELDKGNVEVSHYVKKEVDHIRKLSCYFVLKDYQKGRLELLYQQSKSILIEDSIKSKISQKNYAEIGGLIWDNFNSSIIIDNNGNDISIATNIEQWKSLCDKDQPAYCYYNFVDTNSSLGLIYNYAAVRVLAPDGYRVPSKKDYEVLLEELKRTKQTNTLCSIIPYSSCAICYSCSANDYNTQLNFNLKPSGWLSVSKSKKDKWKDNGEDMYLWTMEAERNNSVLSGLGFAQFKSPSTIKTVDLNEVNNVGAMGNNVKIKEDFVFIEKYYGIFIRFVKN